MPNDEMTPREKKWSQSPTSEIRSALEIVWPDRCRTLLLRSCLCPPAESSAAWRKFRDYTGDTKRFFEGDESGLKGLLPLLYAASKRNNLALDSELQTYLRVATVREELRSEVYREIHADVLKALNRACLPAIALKGGALADILYETPIERHCHAMHLLVRPDGMQHIEGVLQACGFRLARLVEARPGARQGFRHAGGLPLIVNAALYDAPIYNNEIETLWSTSENATISGVPARVPAPVHHLIYVLASAYQQHAPGHLRWACDGWLLIHNQERFDWGEFVDQVQRCGLALPVDTMLRYLVDGLNATIPREVGAALGKSASRSSRPELEAALSGALVGVSSFRDMWMCKLRSRSGRSVLLRFLLLPSTDYLQYRFGLRTRAWAPVRYVYRPLAYVAQRLYWRALRLPGFNRLTYRRRIAAALARPRTGPSTIE